MTRREAQPAREKSGSAAVETRRDRSSDVARRADVTDPLVVPRLVRSAFGMAIGTLLGTTLCGIALYHGLLDVRGEDALFVWLLGANFVPGYVPSLRGALVGLVWGLMYGFLLGWLAAFARDFLLRACVQWVAWKERLRENSRVLDDLL